MNNKAFITNLSMKTGYSQEDTQKMVNTIIDTFANKFQQGDVVIIPNFGSFNIKKRLERIVTNPNTKQKMLIPPKLILNFRPIASIKEKFKNGGIEYE